MAGNWTPEDKQEIVKVFAVLATIQKNYGRQIEMRETLQAWECVIGDIPANQVVAAMQAYMRKSSDMPTPADLIALITPPKAKISQTEFIHAKDQWAKEGFPSYSYYAMVVKNFEKQEEQDRDPAPVTERIGSGGFKKIGN